MTSLTACGCAVDQSPVAFGRLRDSTTHAQDFSELRERLNRDGYIFLRGVVELDVLADARALMLAALGKRGILDTDGARDARVGRARAGTSFYGLLKELHGDDTALKFTRLKSVLSLLAGLFGEPATGLGHAFLRAAGPGKGEKPHCDWVYMSRGTEQLLTAWMPVVDVPIQRGALMLLEGSHLPNRATREYLDMDADSLGLFDGLRFKHGSLVRGGRYSLRPDRVREEFGTRWLTEDFTPGDLVLFGPRLLHATLDNQTAEYRLSVDVRYQPQTEPVDPRFVGSDPVLHSKRDPSIFDFWASVKSAARSLASNTRPTR